MKSSSFLVPSFLLLTSPCYAQIAEESSPAAALMPIPRVGKSGTYSGTLKIIRVEDYYTATGCAIPENRKFHFVSARGVRRFQYVPLTI